MLFLLTSCQSGSSVTGPLDPDSLAKAEAAKKKRGPGGCLLLSGRNTVKVDTVDIEIWVPYGNVKADLLILPGWNFPRTMWCDSSRLCKEALEKGYRLVMPEMGKSLYATEFFEETNPTLKMYPNGTWVAERMIPALRTEHCLFQPDSVNFILGLSTGARGVALTCLKTENLFDAAAGLSGDYDQSLIKGDNLMKWSYGVYDDFPERWEGVDNPTKQAANFNVPIYLGHGKADLVVPFNQTEVFYNELAKSHTTLSLELHLVDFMGHNFLYWDSEVVNVLEFFEKHRSNGGKREEGGV